MKTIFKKPVDFDRSWYVIDAEGKNLGRLASKVAQILRGKHKPYYTPHQECGDFVVVVNADKVAVTGDKLQSKMYYRHSGYMGGLKETNLSEMLDKKPTTPVEKAIKGMLPHNRLGRKIFKNVKVYAGPNHPHGAQKPAALEI
ncbi:50S ribosomal protein L13 [Salinispira pacifica]|uniref:Large ribosomal subunit protein uL13 n=1 Tax=Salinispira pacifica TaxID=1307761 RepID=V5WDC9_9SPIO|nr:50S ribosomal protein L13 [Salinispira pacifica]AHC13605.1 LSU ribosomal protein L13p (L13Ae) [Salinispira pacifica]